MQNFVLPKNVEYIINTLIENNYKAYVVGGCVRDFIMNRIPHDYDICTSALPEQVKHLFEDNKIYDTGLKHGTITLNIDNELYEITTFRTESDYSDNRHPNNVEFVNDICEDLSRRDFTCNAIAYNSIEGFIDPFNGISDIDNNIIRCVRNADERFTEDALRILRAIRFAAKYNFDIEYETQLAIHRHKDLLNNISYERINSEFSQIILYANYHTLSEYRDVFAVFIPEIIPTFDFEQHSKWHDKTVYNHMIYATALAYNSLELKLTMFLHDIAKPQCFFLDENGEGHFYGHPEKSAEITKEILTRLRYTNKQIKTVCELIRLHDTQLNATEKSIRKMVSKHSEQIYKMLLEVKELDNRSQSVYAIINGNLGTIAEIKNIMLNMSNNSKSEIKLKDLVVNGNDIIALGVTGKSIGVILNKLLDKVIECPETNQRENLICLAKEYIKEL